MSISIVNEMFSDVILDRLYKSFPQDSIQLQTVLVFYDQKTVRNNGQTSFSRFEAICKTSSLPDDENPKLRVRDDVVELGSVAKSRKERTIFQRRLM